MFWIVLLILALIFLGWWFFFRGRGGVTLPPPTNTIGINQVSLSISPPLALCNTPGAFTCTITATGWADNITGRNYTIDLIDKDLFPPDDVLATFNSTALGAGVGPTPIPGSVLFRWTVTKVMSLSCDAACEVSGTASSGEQNAQVFARFTITHGNPFPTEDSPVFPIGCVATLPAVGAAGS